jgi:hypothetical protein
MTCPGISHEIEEAAAYIVYGHRHIPLDHPDMVAAHSTLQAAGVWSPGEIVSAQAEHHVEVLLVGVFCSGERRRVIYTILADGIEIGTAIHWTSKTVWPWGLTLPAGCIVNFGFKTKDDLVAAVERFVRTGRLV